MILLVVGAAIVVIGCAVCRAASKANNDGAWVLYGCLPIGAGLLLIAIGAVRALIVT